MKLKFRIRKIKKNKNIKFAILSDTCIVVSVYKTLLRCPLSFIKIQPYNKLNSTCTDNIHYVLRRNLVI